MKHGSARRSRKRAVIFAAACLAVLAVVGVRQMAQRAQANSDLNNLNQQRAARGMPDPEQMRALSSVIDPYPVNSGSNA